MYYLKRLLEKKFLFIFLLFFVASSAQSAEDNILEELLIAAQKNDNQLLIAKARLDAAKAVARQNLAPILPQVSLSIQSSQKGVGCKECPPEKPQDSTESQGRFQVSQTIYEPIKYRVYKASATRAEQLGYEYGSAYLELFQRLLQQYLDILTETDRLRTLGAQRDRLLKQLQVVRAMAAGGSRSPVDVAEIEANAALSEAQYLQSQISLRTFYEGLSESVKLSIKNLPPVHADLDLPPLDNKDPQYWKEIALKNNLKLLAARAAVAAAEEDLKISNRGHIPTFNLFAAYTQSDQAFESYNRDFTQTEVGIIFNVPIFSGGSVFASIKSAKARLEQAKRQLALVSIEVRTLVPSLVRLINNGDKFIGATKQTLDARKALVSQTESRYRLGATDITDLLTAYERLFQAERDYYSSLYSHIKNYADFYIRTGQLNDEQLQQFYKIGDVSNYDPNKAVY